MKDCFQRIAEALIAFFLSATIARLGPLPADADEPGSVDRSPAQRVLEFPADHAIGVVFVREPLENGYSTFRWDEEAGWPIYPPHPRDTWRRLATAQGAVRCPATWDVKLAIGKAASTDLSSLAALGPDTIQVLSLRGTGVNDGALRHVGQLSGLRVLDLSETKVTDAGISHLAGLRNLESLNLSPGELVEEGAGVGDAALKVIADLPNLRRLELRFTKATDQGVAELARIKSLKRLGLEGTAVTDAGVAHLQGLPCLESLSFGMSYDGKIGNRITDAGLKSIGQMAALTHLGLREAHVTDDGISQLKALNKLQCLDLVQTDVTIAGLKRLEPLTELRQVHYSSRKFEVATDADAMQLAKLNSPALRTAPSLNVTANGLSAIATPPDLEFLDLGGANLNYEVATMVGQIKSLKSLGFADSPVNDEALAQLAGLENLETLMLLRTNVTGEGFGSLSRLKKLSKVFLESRFPPVLRDLGQLSSLKELYVPRGAPSNDDLQYLAPLVQLEILNIGLSLDDLGAEHLSKITSLKKLTFINENCAITDRGLKHLSKLSRLESLRVVGGQVTDAGLQQLAEMGSLRELELYEMPNVTEAGLNALEQKMPSLQWTKCGKW
jgi:Leucine-rich repeat (LRR) protein